LPTVDFSSQKNNLDSPAATGIAAARLSSTAKDVNLRAVSYISNGGVDLQWLVNDSAGP